MALFSFGSLIAQIPNNGFESWTTVGSYEDPDNWSTLNSLTSIASIYTATKGTPGNPGTSFLKLTSKTVGPTVVNGVAATGVIDVQTQQATGGFPYTGQPLSFTGKWQHMVYGTSQGSVSAVLTRWDAGTNSRVVVATANQTLSGMAMNWANFSIPFVYTDSQAPDTCLIVLKASGASPTNLDYLWVDNLAFSGSVASLNEVQMIQAVSVFPNPTSSTLNIDLSVEKLGEVKLQLIDLNGKKVIEQYYNLIVTNTQLSVNVSSLVKGTYLLRMEFEGQQNERTVFVQ